MKIVTVYDISPYDETLIIDVDYPVMSDSPIQVWGFKNDFMINYDVQDIQFTRKKQAKKDYKITE